MGNNTKLQNWKNRFVLESSSKSPALSWADIFLSQFILRLNKSHQEKSLCCLSSGMLGSQHW